MEFDARFADANVHLSTWKKIETNTAINDLHLRSEMFAIAHNSLTSEWLAV
jgi:hypothetical protein